MWLEGLNNQLLKPYLQNTTITQKLTAIYKHEEQQQQRQKQQELEQQLQKALEKEHGMGGFGL